MPRALLLRVPFPLAALLAALLATLACAPRERVLVLVSVDTLRSDHVGAYGDRLGLTPNVDALAARSIQFTAAYAPTPYTLPSVSTLLTGRHPQEIGIYGNSDRLAPQIPTLASVLREHGFRTGAVVSNYILRHTSGLDRGFEIFDDEMVQEEAVRRWPERTAGHTTNAALATLDRLREGGPGDTFLWVHYQDPHGPYTPPEGDRERYLEAARARPDGGRELEPGRDNRGVGTIPAYQFLEDRRDVAFYRAGYAGEVRYTDREIGRLLAGLHERGLFEHALLLFAADHGEGLGERDYWFAHGEELIDPLVRVPLLLRVPGRPHVLRNDVVGLEDVFGTLLAALGIDPIPASSGRDLLEEHTEEATTIFMLGASPPQRLGLVHGDYKLILTQNPAPPQVELYELGDESTADDRSEQLPDLATSMFQRLIRIQQNLIPAPRLTQDLSPGERIRLRALGYEADD